MMMIQRTLQLALPILLLGWVCAGCAESATDGASLEGQDFFTDDVAARDAVNSPTCVDGATKPASDGCNTCTCSGGDWVCTTDTCMCPLPRTAVDDPTCGLAVVWARDPIDGTCCLYENDCAAPDGWATWFSANECENACTPGETKLAGDGCNSCECQDDGAWVCTEKQCNTLSQICVTDDDCMVSGCSGQICAPDPIGTTCEWRDEYSCYDESITSCGCHSGRCEWNATMELSACLTENAGCTPGEVKLDTDGCNTCFCTDAGHWACTDRECMQTCPAPEMPASGETCDEGLVFARDPLTGLCCEYSDSCAPPDDWETFGDATSCTAFTGCEPGAERPATDGCNTCTCNSDGTWTCSDTACARLCDTDADCVTTGCSGQVCASEHVFTTCEWEDSYACYNSDLTSCACVDGVCGWEQTDGLVGCLADPGTPP